MNGWGDTVQVLKNLFTYYVWLCAALFSLWWPFRLTCSVFWQTLLCILKKMPPLGTTGPTTWCLSGLQLRTLRCLPPRQKILVTLMKLNGQVNISNPLTGMWMTGVLNIYVSPCSPTFHPHWNHHHGHRCGPCVGRSHFCRHHLRPTFQVVQNGRPPASARGSVPAIRRRQKPICGLRSVTQNMSRFLKNNNNHSVLSFLKCLLAIFTFLENKINCKDV